MTRIDARRLIPGRGDVIEDGAVVIEDTVITYAGSREGAPTSSDAETRVTTDTVMPGLWECHGHFMGTYTAALSEELATTRPQMAAMRVTADANRALIAGFTSVREMGGMGALLGRVIDEGQVVGPNVYGSAPSGDRVGNCPTGPTPWARRHPGPGSCSRATTQMSSASKATPAPTSQSWPTLPT